MTEAIDESSTSAVSAAVKPRTSRSSRVARCRLGSVWSAATKASSTLSRLSYLAAGDASGVPGKGVTQMSSHQRPPRWPPGSEAGPRSTGSIRRCRCSMTRRLALVAIRNSQVRGELRPSKESNARQARTSVSCNASSASGSDPVIR